MAYSFGFLNHPNQEKVISCNFTRHGPTYEQHTFHMCAVILVHILSQSNVTLQFIQVLFMFKKNFHECVVIIN